MSSAQVVVVIFGLIVGYFVVAKLIDVVEDKSPPNFRKKEDNSSTTRNESDSIDEYKGTWFAVLGVPEHSSIEEIHAAYRKLMSQYHPDRVASLGIELRDLAEKKAKEINAAYDIAQKLKGQRR